LSRRVKPLKPKPKAQLAHPRLYLYLGVASVVTVGVGVLVAASIGVRQPQSAAKAPTGPSTRPVTTAVETKVGWHEPVQASEMTTAAAVARFKYNTDPPTSGPSQDVWPKAYVSTRPMSKGLLVQIEKRGNVVVAYGPGTHVSVVREIVAFAHKVDRGSVSVRERSQAGEGIFVTPWPGLKPGHVDLLAWTRLDPLTAWQPSSADTFVGDFLGNAANTAQ